MRLERDKLLRVGGYGGFAGMALLVSAYLTFPAEAVGQRVAHEITKQTGGKLSVSFGDMSLYRLTGFEAEAVKLRTAGETPVEMTLDALRVRLQLLPLLLFRLAASAEVELGEGSIEASVAPGAEAKGCEIELDLDDVDVAKPPLLPGLVGLPFGGVIGGKAELSWSADPQKSAGKASLTIREASLGPGEVQGFTLPSTSLGQLDLAFDLRGGRLRLASFQQKGGDLSAKASASIALRPRMRDSSLDVCIEIRPADAFLGKNPKIKSVVDLAQVKFRKDDNGYLHVPLGGTFGAVRQRGGLCRTGGAPRGGAEE